MKSAFPLGPETNWQKTETPEILRPSRMSRLGNAEIVTGELLSVDEVLARYRAVTAADIRDVVEELTQGEPTVVTVGPAPTLAS